MQSYIMLNLRKRGSPAARLSLDPYFPQERADVSAQWKLGNNSLELFCPHIKGAGEIIYWQC